MAEDNKCPVCTLSDGHHDIGKHRQAVNSQTVEALERSISRHPAGSRRKAKDEPRG